jgi:hypothetical protein
MSSTYWLLPSFPALNSFSRFDDKSTAAAAVCLGSSSFVSHARYKLAQFPSPMQ